MSDISFDEIPFDWLEPGSYFEVRPNYRYTGILPYPARALLTCHKLAVGTLAEGDVVEITRDDDAIPLLGLGSIGLAQVKAFKKTNKTSPLFITALGDAVGAVKATGTFTFAGAITADIVLRFKLNKTQIRATLLSGDNVSDMATKLANAINLDTTLPITAGAAAGVVTITSRHGGEVGNEIDLRVDTKAQAVPNGLTITIADMSGGTGNPDLTTALDAVTNEWFTQMQQPWNDPTNMAAFAAELDSRYTAMSKLDAHGFVGKRGTFGELSTWGDLVNSPFLSLFGLNNSPTAPWELAASSCGLATFHLTNDPARQLKSLVVLGVQAPDTVDQFTETENDLLLRKGISTFDHLPDGSTVISRVITSYNLSTLSTLDRAWMDIMTPATMSRIRYDWAAYVSLLYPRAKLVDDEDNASLVSNNDENEDGDPGNSVVTPRRMHGSWAARCALYGERAWIEDVRTTVKQSIFERDDSDKNRLNSRQQVRIVGNLMVLAGALEFQV